MENYDIVTVNVFFFETNLQCCRLVPMLLMYKIYDKEHNILPCGTTHCRGTYGMCFHKEIVDDSHYEKATHP